MISTTFTFLPNPNIKPPLNASAQPRGLQGFEHKLLIVDFRYKAIGSRLLTIGEEALIWDSELFVYTGDSEPNSDVMVTVTDPPEKQTN